MKRLAVALAFLVLTPATALASGPPYPEDINGAWSTGPGCSEEIVEGVTLYGTGQWLWAPDYRVTWVYSEYGIGDQTGDYYEVTWTQADHAAGHGYTERLTTRNVRTGQIGQVRYVSNGTEAPGEYKVAFEGCIR